MTLPGAPARESLAAPSGLDAVLLAIALTGVSFSGPIMAATAAPALAIAFWRNAFGGGVTALVASVRSHRELRALPARSWRLSALAGVALAAHFGLWIPSVTMTSIASSVALVSTQTVFTAGIAQLSGRTLPRLAWLGMVLATVATALITGADVGHSWRAVLGDLLAVAGGFCAAVYVTIGAAARTRLSTAAYTVICYATCALLLLAVCLIGRVQLVGFSGNAWLKIAAVTICAQLLGHSLINVVLRSTSATVVSMAILLEVPGAALVAAVWLAQRPPLSAVPGIVLLLGGLVLVASSRNHDDPVESTE
ncbi:MAG: DMT family transporter [Actinomycetota bacterium]